MNLKLAKDIVDNGNNDALLHEAVIYLRDKYLKEKYGYMNANTVENSVKVSIIIPFYNHWEMTLDCIQSVRDNTEGDYEIILADDCSKERIEVPDDVIYNRNDTNLGFLLNCNNAATMATGDLICFLNNDTLVTKDWLKYIIEAFADETVGICGAKLISKDGMLLEAGSIIFNNGRAWNYGYGKDKNHFLYNYTKEVDYVSGACLVIRKELWEEIGGFDERYAPAYCEDSDICMEARKHGYKVVYQFKSEVIHLCGVSHKDEFAKHQIVNNEKLYQKWHRELSEHGLQNYDIFHARDRSRGRKTILVVDYQKPYYEKTDVTMLEYLELLVSKGLNVKLLIQNNDSLFAYVYLLRENGIEVITGNEKTIGNYLLQNGSKFDYVMFNNHKSFYIMNFIRDITNAKFIYYGLELNYLKLLRDYELTGNSALLEQSNKIKGIEFEMFDSADYLCLTTEEEAEVVRSENPSLRPFILPKEVLNNKSTASKTLNVILSLSKENRTMLYCTCYVGDERGLERMQKWINYYKSKKDLLGVTHIVVIDDGSPLEWIERLNCNLFNMETMHQNGTEFISIPKKLSNTEVNILRFPNRLGRPHWKCFPGWWRSYAFGAEIGTVYNFDKFIFLESDAYLLSDRVFYFIKNQHEGFGSFWSAASNYRESSIQWCMRSEFYRLHHFWQTPDNKMNDEFWLGVGLHVLQYIPEYILPFTNDLNIVKLFKGDRYGDDHYAEIPERIDYICQTSDISLDGKFRKKEKLKQDIINQLIT